MFTIAMAGASAPLPPCAEMPPTSSLSLPVDPSAHFFVPPDVTYLNVATLGHTPRGAVTCAARAWSALESNPAELYDWGDETTDDGSSNGSRLDAVRTKAAAMLGVAHVDELSFVPSTTTALHWVAQGMVSSGYVGRSRGQRVLTTDMEHRGGLAAWEHCVDAGFLEGIDRVSLPAPARSEQEIIDRFEDALFHKGANSKTYAAVSVSHVLTTTGTSLPLPEIAALAHDRGALLVVDGAQAAGSVHVDIDATGADAYAISGHKGLLGPTGSGLLYLRAGCGGRIRPAVLDRGAGAYTHSSGTAPFQTILALGYSLDFIEAAAAGAESGGGGGLSAVVSHGQDLARLTQEGFERLSSEVGPGVRPLSPPAGSAMATSIVTLALPPEAKVDNVIGLSYRQSVLVTVTHF